MARGPLSALWSAGARSWEVRCISIVSLKSKRTFVIVFRISNRVTEDIIDYYH